MKLWLCGAGLNIHIYGRHVPLGDTEAYIGVRKRAILVEVELAFRRETRTTVFDKITFIYYRVQGKKERNRKEGG